MSKLQVLYLEIPHTEFNRLYNLDGRKMGRGDNKLLALMPLIDNEYYFRFTNMKYEDIISHLEIQDTWLNGSWNIAALLYTLFIN